MLSSPYNTAFGRRVSLILMTFFRDGLSHTHLHKHVPGVAVLVSDLLFHLGVRQCFEERTPLISIGLAANGDLHQRQRSLTVPAKHNVGT